MKVPIGRPSLRPYLPYQQRAATHREGLTAHFLGTSSVLLTDGRTSLLSDGFITRPGMLRVGMGKIAPDRALVRAAAERLRVDTLAAVVCAHSHYDHALDAPVWALETGAELVGSESTANIGRGLEVPESSLRVVGHGDTVTYGSFTLTFLDSVHSPGDHYPGTVDEPLVPPARAGAWKTGTAYSVLITHPHGRVLLQASANYRPGALRGHHADVIYLGVGMLGGQPAEFLHTYWDEVVVATGARRVILVHWDDFFLGLDRPLRPMPYLLDDLGTTMSRLLPLARRDGVDVVLPVSWQPSAPLAGIA
ncbi:MBL fold metallo-hydrolase [Streptomyces sp. BK340]|uniref:MBL fold metallo-hydrolase n=1 Tax=Streptomyces sp. BK340 TaxID=2572903 RepID=UPI0011AD54DE|nr:MBL fold metallo-hydrolase [Streptomyces sp. BK340]TVZ87368.1 L-ascorbate metabolism protein UlaG (beta-lactamase superfamily) [Streptomyces sp. BK340]